MFAALCRQIARIRLAIAESDLHWMEAQAPHQIAQARARVLALQARVNRSPRVHHSAQDIANHIARQSARHA